MLQFVFVEPLLGFRVFESLRVVILFIAEISIEVKVEFIVVIGFLLFKSVPELRVLLRFYELKPLSVVLFVFCPVLFVALSLFSRRGIVLWSYQLGIVSRVYLLLVVVFTSSYCCVGLHL